MKKDKTITIKVTSKDYERINQSAAKERISISEYIRSRIDRNISKDWIKKTTVQKVLSNVAVTLDKYEEKNLYLTNTIKKKLCVLWEKL